MSQEQKSSNSSHCILIVDDDEYILDFLRVTLQKQGYQVKTSDAPHQVAEILFKNHIDLVLLDYMMEPKGLDLLEQLKQQNIPLPPMIMMTSYGSIHLAVSFIRAGGFDFIQKPLDMEVLLVKIEKNLQLAKEMQQTKAKKEQAQQELRELNQQLRQSNQNLKNFAYIASHDLKEPLRKVKMLSRLLEKEITRELSAKGEDYLLRLKNTSERMEALIDNLLLLSKVEKQPDSLVKISLDKVLQELVEDLSETISEKNADLEIGKLPEIEADPTQMRLLFQNLITNALKFQPPERKPKIQIFAEIHQNRAKLFVKDNGIGLQEENQQRIFKIFERVHGRGEYEGAGIGLAICDKIVKRHQGKITLESQLQKGTTFIMDLPLTQRRVC